MSNSEEQPITTQNSDEAPETVSLSASKLQALNVKKKEYEAQQKYNIPFISIYFLYLLLKYLF